MSWAEEQDWWGLEDLAIEAEASKSPQDLIEDEIWLQANGQEIYLEEMSIQHLNSCIRMIEDGRLHREWALPYLKQEQKRRK